MSESSLLKPEMRFTPPRRARRLMAPFVTPWMLSLRRGSQGREGHKAVRKSANRAARGGIYRSTLR